MKTAKKILVLLLALAMATAFLAGCGGNTGGSDADSGSESGLQLKETKNPIEDEIKIAYIPLSMLGQLNIPAATAFEEVLVQFPNVVVDQFEAKYDPTTQISLIEEAVTQNYDAIILECTDPAAVSNAVTAAEEAGVPVITNDVGCDAVHTAHIESASYEAGASAAENVAGLLGNTGKVVILDGPAEQVTSVRQSSGFQDYAKDNTGLEILDYQNVAQWSQENANTIMRDLLTKYDDIDAVYACSDDMAMGAIQAINAAGREGDGIVVWGYVGNLTGLTNIKEGLQAGTNFMDTYARTTAQLNVALYIIANGLNAQVLGLEETPTIALSCPAVTAENIDTYLLINRYEK